MARALTTEQKNLLRSPDLHMNALFTFYMDEGIFRLSDEMTGFDVFDGVNTWIGANSVLDMPEVRTSQDLQAESVTLILDGQRMSQAGIVDPAGVIVATMASNYQQRRVDIALGFRYSYSPNINLIIPIYAGKINSARLIDDEVNEEGGSRVVSKLEIILDSLANRYRRASNRTRSHEDQLSIDPTDQFYSFTVNIAVNEKSIYWGRDAPYGLANNAGINAGYSQPRASGIWWNP